MAGGSRWRASLHLTQRLLGQQHLHTGDDKISLVPRLAYWAPEDIPGNGGGEGVIAAGPQLRFWELCAFGILELFDGLWMFQQGLELQKRWWSVPRPPPTKRLPCVLMTPFCPPDCLHSSRAGLALVAGVSASGACCQPHDLLAVSPKTRKV